MNISEFLLARFADDEEDVRIALAATAPLTESPEQWESITWTWAVHTRRVGGGGASNIAGKCPDPTRLLAECEAKRMIVGHRQVYDMPTHQPHASDPFCIAELDAVLRELAQPYAGHPDFRQEWRL